MVHRAVLNLILATSFVQAGERALVRLIFETDIMGDVDDVGRGRPARSG